MGSNKYVPVCFRTLAPNKSIFGTIEHNMYMALNVHGVTLISFPERVRTGRKSNKTTTWLQHSVTCGTFFVGVRRHRHLEFSVIFFVM